jgi:dihydroxyacetone kinase-like protein
LFILEEVLATAADELDADVPAVDATSPTIPDDEADAASEE